MGFALDILETLFPPQTGRFFQELDSVLSFHREAVQGRLGPPAPRQRAAPPPPGTPRAGRRAEM